MFKRQARSVLNAKRRLSPLVLVGVSIPIVLIVVAGIIFILPQITGIHAAAANVNCTLIVPANPLSAQGLATPYQLTATDPANGPCREANPLQAAFVQGTVIDPATGAVSVYNPLVVDKGKMPAIMPTMPQLPANAIVGLWFGFNGMNLTLRGQNGSLQQGNCVNGLRNSVFGEFAYCNAPTFFMAANTAIAAGQLKPPALGIANDGMPCPTLRDFSVVDQDQSDNVTTTYLVTANGQIAQMTAANAQALQNAQTQVNASDNNLLDVSLDSALGCAPWKVPDLADNGNMASALPLNELQASALQLAPVATVPVGDPMVLNNAQPSLMKLNAYRIGVDQIAVGMLNDASTTIYCMNMLNIAPARLRLDSPITKQRPSPNPAVANSLFTFLAQRFNTSFGAGGLNCTGLLNRPNPITLKTNENGMVINAIIKVPGGKQGQ